MGNPALNPQPGGLGALGLESTLRPVRHGSPYQEYNTPADRALGVIETHKLSHSGEVVKPSAGIGKSFTPRNFGVSSSFDLKFAVTYSQFYHRFLFLVRSR